MRGRRGSRKDAISTPPCSDVGSGEANGHEAGRGREEGPAKDDDVNMHLHRVKLTRPDYVGRHGGQGRVDESERPRPRFIRRSGSFAVRVVTGRLSATVATTRDRAEPAACPSYTRVGTRTSSNRR